MSNVLITVRGEHEVRLTPEQGVVHVTLRAEGPDRAPVLERIGALALPFQQDLAARQRAGTLDEWSSQQTAIWSDRPWNSDGTRLAPVHYATVDLTATFSDFAVLSEWVSEIAERDGVQIGSVEWKLTPVARATREREVAVRAVNVAVERATAYARALGHDSVTAVEIADVGLLGRGDGVAFPQAANMMRAVYAMDAGGEGAVRLLPADIVLVAAVEARFTAS